MSNAASQLDRYATSKAAMRYVTAFMKRSDLWSLVTLYIVS